MNKNSHKAGIAFAMLAVSAILMICMICPASAAVLPSVADNPASMIVQSYACTPSILMPGDSGIVSVTLLNNGQLPASINKAVIHDSDGVESTVTDYYNDFGSVAPGNTVTITMPIKAGSKTGTFYPVFYVDFNRGMTYLKQPLVIVVDDTALDISLTSVPDVFPATGSETIGITLANRLGTDLTSVSVTAEGKGVICKERSVFVGTVTAGTPALAELTVKTDNAKDVKLVVSYSNGANKHTSSITIPAGAETTKSTTLPDFVFANFKVTKGDTFYTLKADINNMGFSTAKSLKITTIEGTDVGPYPVYPIGNLDADDLAGFEITFNKPASDELTLVITYKNDSGDVITEYYKVNIANHLIPEETDYTPLIATIIIVIIAGLIVFIVIRKHKKGKKN